jgi:uncharacterized membrane protein YbhN (UPF0104 family)
VKSPPSTLKKWLLRGAKLVILIVVIWAVRRTLYQAWAQLGGFQWNFQWGWVAASGALYLLGLLPASLFWHRVLRVLGQDAQFGEAARAYYVGHLGKYVPGKAMVVIIRTAMIRSHRVDTGVAAVSVFFETLTMMSVGAFLAAAFLAASFRDELPMLLAAVGLMVVAGLPTLPPVFKRLVRLVGVGKSDPRVAEKLNRLGYGTLLTGWGLMALGWVVLGLSYWATLKALQVPNLDLLAQLPRYTASVSLAMVAGFLIVVLPGGAIVREMTLAELMIPYLARLTPEAQLVALASVAMWRLVSVSAELIVSSVAYPLGARRPEVAQPSGLPKAE